MAGHTHTGGTPFLVSPASGHDTRLLLLCRHRRRQGCGGGGRRGGGVRAGVERDVVARGVPPDDGHGGADGADAAVRAPGHGLGPGPHGAHRRRRRHLLHLLPHVQGARPPGSRRPSPYPLPGARRRRPRICISAGSGWIFYLVVTVQTLINAGITIGSILIAGNCLQIMYSSLAPDGDLKLYHFIIIVAVVLALFSQMPSFHSLRYINLGSLLLCFGYTILVSGACIRAGMLDNAPVKDYSLSPSKSGKTFDAFLSVSILATVFGNGILPEIQATLVPPAAGKMVKALTMCYTVVFFTFYLLAISGYWAFGNAVQSNALQSLIPDVGPSLAPTWLLGLPVVLVLLQLLAIALVYSQVAYEIMEKRSADAAHGRFSRRNLVPRVALRTGYVAACAFVAAALPFFGDIVGVVGAVGFIPLDFVPPVVMYNVALAPPRRSLCTLPMW